MAFLFTARRLAWLTAVLGVLTVWAVLARTELAIPLSAGLVLAGFGWHLSRLGDPGTRPAPTGPCGGCRAGCVECRERLDQPA